MLFGFLSEAPDNLDDARFMTVFFFLNDVTEGGETVLFGTDLNGTYGKERALQGESRLGRLGCGLVRTLLVYLADLFRFVWAMWYSDGRRHGRKMQKSHQGHQL